MSVGPSKEPEARLFFALDPPETIRGQIVRWQESALTDPAIRPVPSPALHSTLCFLGSKPESEIPALSERLREEMTEPIEIRLEPDPVGLPEGRPRLYALGATSEGAAGLRGRLIQSLVAAGLHERETRPFWLHFTVGRISAEAGAKRRPKRVEKAPHKLPEALLSPFHAVRVALYRSYLRPSGSHYVSLASLELPHPAQTGAEKR